MYKMEGTENEKCQSCGKNHCELFILPCCHSNCSACVKNNRNDGTLSCGRCRTKYNVVNDDENVSLEQSSENFPFLQVTVSTGNDDDVWCCFCGDYITNCEHRFNQSTIYASAQSTFSEDEFASDNKDLCASQDSHFSDDVDFLSTPGTSLDFDSLLGSIDDPVDCSDFYSSQNLDKCAEHDFPSTNYCFSHEIICCAECTQLHHKYCNTKDIREAAMETPCDSDVENLQMGISSLMDVQESLVQEMERNDAEIDEHKQKIGETFKEFKGDVFQHLSQLEENLQKSVQDVESERKCLRKEIENFKERGEALESASHQAQENFVKSAESLQRYCNLKAKLKEQKDYFRTQRKHVTKLKVNISKKVDFNEILFKIPDLLQVSHEKVKPETMKKLKCQEKLKVRRWTHTQLPRITGMCYLGDTLVICDHVKERLFTYDTERVWHCFRLARPPWDVTAIEKQKLAVSCSSPTGIQIVDLEFYPSKELGFPRFLPTDFSCYGVEYFEGNLYIASETHIRILRVDGSNLRSLKCPSLSVRYLSVYDTDNIYFTDTNSNSVYCMDSNGRILMVFGSKSLDSPKGIAIGPSTNIIVVNAASSTVIRFTKDGRRVESSKLKNEDKQRLEAVCCNSDACAFAAGQSIYKCQFL